MLNPEQLEKIMLLVKQYTAWARKWERWHAMSNSGIGAYLIHHNEIFGWETYWERYGFLQKYANAKMAECLREQKAIGEKIAAVYKEGL